ncbi:MAG TPA: hypothetical protein VL882_17740, partial [Vicinamibacterales bacterium]|nr:hypothetical protein [Vicinamibacterales bacterium]
MPKREAILLVVALTVASNALAQSSTSSSSQPQQPGGTPTTSTAGTQQSGSSGDVETRPATTTVNGDTGLWFVPTGEILPAKKWSVSAYRVNFDRNQGFTDVSDWPVT